MHLRLLFAALYVALLAAPARADGYLRYLPSSTQAVFVVNVGALAEEDRKAPEAFVRHLYLSQVVPELKEPDKIPISGLKQMVLGQKYAGEVEGVILLR